MPNKDKPWCDLSLPSLGSVGFIVAAYLYLAGWSNCYWFLKYFGISINAVSIQFYYVFIYSIHVIFSWRTLKTESGLLLCVIILSVFYVAFFYR